MHCKKKKNYNLLTTLSIIIQTGVRDVFEIERNQLTRWEEYPAGSPENGPFPAAVDCIENG